MLSRGHRIVFKSGETLFREGDPALRCYFVQNGCFKLSKLHEEGKEATIRYINPGEVIAAIAVFKGKNYPVTAAAIGAAEVVGWGKETMLKLMLEYAPLAANMLRAVIERIDELQTRYLELVAEQVGQRVARALLRIMKQSGRKTSDGILIDMRLGRQELADYTGTTLYTVSRTLSSWEKSGWVKSSRERITVTDPHALVMFAEKG
ncbi:MAG: Crp/Fnr family transcriptional regulator [Desulfobacterales bacterium]